MKNKKTLLAASLVCANPLDLQSDIKELEKAGIDYIHFDVMDGNFVPRLGLFPEILTSLKKITKIPVDVHLMIANPDNFIPAFIQAGADIVVVHAESTAHLDRSIRLIKNLGAKAGVALNPATPLSVLDYVLDDIDMVMLMAINPGILGHKLIPISMKKIADLKKRLHKHPKILIEIDGGVTFESAKTMVKNGADMLVCGTSTIFKPDQSITTKVKELRKTLGK